MDFFQLIGIATWEEFQPMYTIDTSNHFLVQILKCSYLQLTDLIIRSRSFFFIHLLEGLYLEAYSVPDSGLLAN